MTCKLGNQRTDYLWKMQTFFQNPFESSWGSCSENSKALGGFLKTYSCHLLACVPSPFFPRLSIPGNEMLQLTAGIQMARKLSLRHQQWGNHVIAELLYVNCSYWIMEQEKTWLQVLSLAESKSSSLTYLIPLQPLWKTKQNQKL